MRIETMPVEKRLDRILKKLLNFFLRVEKKTKKQTN